MNKKILLIIISIAMLFVVGCNNEDLNNSTKELEETSATENTAAESTSEEPAAIDSTVKESTKEPAKGEIQEAVKETDSTQISSQSVITNYPENVKVSIGGIPPYDGSLIAKEDGIQKCPRCGNDNAGFIRKRQVFDRKIHNISYYVYECGNISCVFHYCTIDGHMGWNNGKDLEKDGTVKGGYCNEYWFPQQ